MIVSLRHVFVTFVLLADVYYFAYWIYVATMYNTHYNASSYFYENIWFPISGIALDVTLFVLTSCSLFLLNFRFPFKFIPPNKEVIRFWVSALHGLFLFAFLWSHM